MAQLRGLAIVAKDPGRLADFYRRVFELKAVSESGSGILLSDGTFTLGLLKNGSGNAGMRAAGFRVESAKPVRDKFKGTATKGSAYAEWQIADPDGNLLDVSEKPFSAACAPGPFPLRHIALYTPNPRRLADFYGEIFAMKEVSHTDRSSIFVSDGYFNLALLFERPGEEQRGFNHFGFHVKDIEEMRDRAEGASVSRGAKRPDRIPFAEYRLHDPEGNGIDISVKGWEV